MSQSKSVMLPELYLGNGTRLRNVVEVPASSGSRCYDDFFLIVDVFFILL